MNIEFPGFSIHNMLDVMIEDFIQKEEQHRFVIIELRDKLQRFSLKFNHRE